MYLYRIEHYDSRIGPYRHHSNNNLKIPNVIFRMMSAHSNIDHPGMKDEFKHIMPERMIKEYYCGFSNAEQCAEWFKDFLKPLRAYGFIIAVYMCEDTHHGAVQSIFRMSTATRVDELPIDILL